MTYNKQELPRYVETAGKITVLTALTGVLIFAFIFILNIGKTELQKAEAQSGQATTTLTVLNTPPQWVPGEEAREELPSSTSTPTNSGSQVSWVATAIDSNGAPYFLIVCSNSATPTAQQSTTTLGTAAPICSGGGTRWAVSTSTISGNVARAATTTLEGAPFAESNTWYGWVCDDDPVNPRCSTTYSQGINATNSSPFNVNRRPVFTGFSNNGPTPPGGTIVFTSTSTDPDVVDAEDTIYLVVCGSASYSTTTNQCGAGDTVASSSIPGSLSNATTSRVLAAIVQDASNYAAFPYVFDQHGHSATGGAQGINVPFTVSNVSPTVSGATISLNGGLDMTLTNPGGQTTGFNLSFVVADANSCDAVGGGPADEITKSVVSVLRSGVGTSTCNGTAGAYNPNNCYTSGSATSTWNLSCTASSTSCTGATDDTIIYNCTFPLWFLADPTNGTALDTPNYTQHWVAGVAGVDNNNATGSMATSTSVVEVQSLVAIGLLDSLIPYSQLEPGDNMPTLSASTTMQVLGNTGLNQLLGGDSMCIGYSPLSPCNVSATTTIPQSEQRFATSAVAYGSGLTLQPTSTPSTLLIQIPKPISTSTPTSGKTFWGIAVPGSITVAGAYTGRNTFTGAVSAPITW